MSFTSVTRCHLSQEHDVQVYDVVDDVVSTSILRRGRRVEHD